MMKLRFVTLFILVGFLITACGTQPEENYSTAVEEEPKEAIGADEDTGLTYVQFLEDLDYMLYVLENNFALFDVAYWAHGADIPAIIGNVREAVLANPDMDVIEFYVELVYNFAPLVGVGHFSLLGPQTLYNIINDTHAHQRAWFSPSAIQRISRPHVVAFSRPEAAENAEAANLTGSERQRQILIDRAVLYGEPELASDMVQAMEAGDFEETLRLADLLNDEIIANAPNITTEIIEEGRIAYLSINSFGGYPTQQDESQVFDFYEEIRDSEHLIVDLRRNRGGNMIWFHRLIIGPNIESNSRVDGYAFVVYGEYSTQYTSSLLGRGISVTSMIHSRDDQMRPIAEILENYNLPDINMTDMERMDYGFRIQTTVNPRHFDRFDNQPAFDGKVWLLTGSGMGSATEASAWIAKDTGFATLVGEVTGGAFGGRRTYVALPNSGIVFQADLFYVTDRHGRPLEAGTVPHHFNREGMDALETVLQLIEEGNY
ncbi:MAG: S41 family peptidase [Defluviitaleaceae bacterium]|nr:S41 family peptidase [Defluviitaleaceae bacterium]